MVITIPVLQRLFNEYIPRFIVIDFTFLRGVHSAAT